MRLELKSKNGDTFAELASAKFDEFTIVNTDGSAYDPSRPLPIVGSGHFGVVVRAIDSDGLHRAIKFLDISRFGKRAIAPTVTPEELVDSLRREMRLTNQRLLKHVVPVLATGSCIDVRRRTVPFTVSPFVDGPLLHVHLKTLIDSASRRKHARDLAAMHDLLLALIDDLLGALVELEESQVSHLDLKPTNIVIQRAGLRHSLIRDQAFAIDFSGAISLKPQREGLRVPLMFTPGFFPDDVLSKIDADDSNTVEHATVAELGPAIDRHCCARTIEVLILDQVSRGLITDNHQPEFARQEKEKEANWREALNDDFEVIEGLIARLRINATNGFENSADARQGFQAIARRNSTAILSSRALTDSSKGVVIYTGIRPVRVVAPYQTIIDHPVFKRLNQMQQLTFVSDVFPGATHTRFSHCVSTFGLAKDFLLALNRESEFRLLVDRHDAEQIMAAALLHDLGQYPFSHTVEDLKKTGDLFEIPKLDQIKHDQDLALEYIDKTEDGQSIRGILEDHGLNVSEILYMISKKAKKDTERPALNIGRDIVSGVIDVDRISYVLHDSEATGLGFGAAVDVNALVDSLCIRSAGKNSSLAIREHGVSAVEALLSAVYWMYKNVYWHPINRGMMAAIKHVFADLLTSNKMTFDGYRAMVYGKGERNAIAYLNDLYQQHLEKHREWWNPISALADGKRSELVRVWSLGGRYPRHENKIEPQEFDLYREVYKRLDGDLPFALIAAIERGLPAGVSPRRGEILIDIPMKKRLLESLEIATTRYKDTETEIGRREPLWVKLQSRHKPGRWAMLEQHTPLVKALAEAEDLSARKIRVYFSKALLQRCSKQPVDLWAAIDHAVRAVVEPKEGSSDLGPAN